MINKSLPIYLEDRTGAATGSDFDDVYDRVFLRVSPASNKNVLHGASLLIHNVGRRSSSQKDYRPALNEPAAVLEFGPQGSLGRILFVSSATSIPMAQYLKKSSMFASSLSRKFRASDGEEYRWTYRTVADQEWTCVDPNGFLVAHYTLKPPEKLAYKTSGNVLTIQEAYADLAVELLASLTVMRHIAAYSL